MRTFLRLPKPPEVEQFVGEEHAEYQLVAERTARVHGSDGPAAQYFGALLHSPPIAAALTRIGTVMRSGEIRGTYSDAERELMDIALAAYLKNNSILPIHIPDAVAVGVPLGTIEALLVRRDEELGFEDLELVNFARSFVDGTVTDDQYERIRRRFGERGAVEFTALLGFLLLTIRLWQALGVSEPSDQEVFSLIQGIRSGSIEIPDKSARIG